MAPLVSMNGITKFFGPVKVLDQVDFSIYPGEVHILAGENGAGKSTLVKILAGAYSDYQGRISMEERGSGLPAPLMRTGTGSPPFTRSCHSSPP